MWLSKWQCLLFLIWTWTKTFVKKFISSCIIFNLIVCVSHVCCIKRKALNSFENKQTPSPSPNNTMKLKTSLQFINSQSITEAMSSLRYKATPLNLFQHLCKWRTQYDAKKSVRNKRIIHPTQPVSKYLPFLCRHKHNFNWKISVLYIYSGILNELKHAVPKVEDNQNPPPNLRHIIWSYSHIFDFKLINVTWHN